MPDPGDNAIESAKAILSEHFENFAIVVLDSEDLIYPEYSSKVIARQLFREGLAAIGETETAEEEYEWEDEDDDD